MWVGLLTCYLVLAALAVSFACGKRAYGTSGAASGAYSGTTRLRNTTTISRCRYPVIGGESDTRRRYQNQRPSHLGGSQTAHPRRVHRERHDGERR